MPAFRRLLAFLLFCAVAGLTACGPGDAPTATAAPAITTQPVGATSDGLSPTTLSVVATGGALSYQWFQDGAAIAGATKASYSTATAGSYYVVVTNSMGSITSATAVLVINLDPVITVQPQSAMVTTGKSARLSVVATGLGLSYQWYLGGTAIQGATSTAYTASAAGSYTVLVSSSRAGAKPVTSAVATVTVSATAIVPTITTQPVAQRVTAGAAASFSVVATGTDLTYQWYKDAVLIGGATNPGYAIDTATSANAGSYYVVVTNSAGFAASNTAALTVTPVGSGSNTGAVLAAANTFLGTLTASQVALAPSAVVNGTVQFADTLENARTWTSLVGARHGLRLNTSALTATQLAAANALIATALSAAGDTMMSEIRLSDDALASLSTSSGAGSALYSIAFIGQPSATQPWMLQLTGHQLTYNITYNATQVSATPMFLGAEPPNWTFSSSGAYTVNNTAGSSGTPHAPMEAQRQAVSDLAAALQADTTLAAAAKLTTVFSDLVMGPGASSDTAFRTVAYPSGTTGRGVVGSKLSSAQLALMKAAIQAWAKTQAADVAEALLGAYLTDDALASTYVAYAPGQGGTADFGAYPNASALPGSAGGSYLRIDGPRVWIEFLVKSADGTLAANVHYRSVWRDKTADYGGRY